jgi:DNA adenine methylase
MKDASPLRYPGGKWRVASFFVRLIEINFSRAPIYVEAYAGGASLALSLLFSGVVAEVHLNDLDQGIAAFWRSILEETDAFIGLIEEAKVNPEEWLRQRCIHKQGDAAGVLALGFATFFLNRTNHSGILNGGMIGGKSQTGAWRLDARFNRRDLIRRIERIASYREKIHLTRIDALSFLAQCQALGDDILIYLDPPYFNAGYHLYLNNYTGDDHRLLRDAVLAMSAPWVLSYDDVAAIRVLYRGYRRREFRLLHSARAPRVGKEVVYFSPCLAIPKNLEKRTMAGPRGVSEETPVAMG